MTVPLPRLITIPWLLLAMVTCAAARVSMGTIGGRYSLCNVSGIRNMPFCSLELQVPASADGRISAQSLQPSCTSGTWEFQLSTNLTDVTKDTENVVNFAASFPPNTLNCNQYVVSAFHIFPSANATALNVKFVGGFRYIVFIALADPQGVCLYQEDQSLSIKEPSPDPIHPPEETQPESPEPSSGSKNRLKRNRYQHWRWLGPLISTLIFLSIIGCCLVIVFVRRRINRQEQHNPETTLVVQYDDVYAPVAEDAVSVTTTAPPPNSPPRSVSTTQYTQAGGDGEVQQFSGFPSSAPPAP